MSYVGGGGNTGLVSDEDPDNFLERERQKSF